MELTCVNAVQIIKANSSRSWVAVRVDVFWRNIQCLLLVVWKNTVLPDRASKLDTNRKSAARRRLQLQGYQGRKFPCGDEASITQMITQMQKLYEARVFGFYQDNKL